MIAAPFEKTYLSRAQSRIWSMDNPVGDPFGGPAYGEKNAPVAMIAAVVSIGVGATAVATATAITLTAVMGGLMVAGGAMSLVGIVSGNDNLAKIGGVVAAVGGVGMAASNFLSSAATSTAGAVEASQAAAAAETTGSGLTTGTADLATGGAMANGAEVTQTVAAPEITNTVNASQTAEPGLINNAVAPEAPVIDAPKTVSSDLVGSAADVVPDEVITASTPDSTFRNVFDQAGSDVKNMWANENNFSQYASNAGKPDITPLSDELPQQLPSQVQEAAPQTATAPQSVQAPQQTAQSVAAPQQPVQQSLQPVRLNGGEVGYTNSQGQVFNSGGTYLGQAPGFETTGTPTVLGPNTGGSGGSGIMSKIEGFLGGIEKYKNTANIGGNLISGAMKYAYPSQLAEAETDYTKAAGNLKNAQAVAIQEQEERRKRNNQDVANFRYTPISNNGLIRTARG